MCVSVCVCVPKTEAHYHQSQPHLDRPQNTISARHVPSMLHIPLQLSNKPRIRFFFFFLFFTLNWRPVDIPYCPIIRGWRRYGFPWSVSSGTKLEDLHHKKITLIHSVLPLLFWGGVALRWLLSFTAPCSLNKVFCGFPIFLAARFFFSLFFCHHSFISIFRINLTVYLIYLPWKQRWKHQSIPCLVCPPPSLCVCSQCRSSHIVPTMHIWATNLQITFTLFVRM